MNIRFEYYFAKLFLIFFGFRLDLGQKQAYVEYIPFLYLPKIDLRLLSSSVNINVLCLGVLMECNSLLFVF